jgi:hypothetical protein
MTEPERLRGSLYPDHDGPRFVIRAVDPEPDLAAALAAARRPGTFTKARRGWTVQGGRLILRFELLEPRSCKERSFFLVRPELLSAFLDGCGVDIATRAAGAWPRRGIGLVPLWPREGARTAVLDALAENLGAELGDASANDVERWEREA